MQIVQEKITISELKKMQVGNKMIIHKELAAGRWFELSLIEQMANIGSDVVRTIKWKNKHRLKEILRTREVLVGEIFLFF